MQFRKGMFVFVLLGLIMGIGLDLLIRYKNLTAFNYAFISLFTLLYALAYDEKKTECLILSTLLVTLFLCIPLLPLKIDMASTNYMHMLTFLIAFPFFVYIVHSFHYAYHRDNTTHVSYSSLFAAVWNTVPLLFLAFLFSSLANLLIMMTAFIFKTVNSTYLWDLYFTNHHFGLISNSILFFIGLGVGQQNIKIIYSLRFLLLRIMFYLFPFLALISTIYFVLYVGHTLSGGTQYIEPLYILLPLSIMGIIFFNGYFQDGTTDSEYPSWLENCLRIYRGILFLLALMTVYRILHLSAVEVNSFICLIAGILFTLTYAITAMASGDEEREWIKNGNIATALLFVISLFLLNIPYLPLSFNIGPI